MFFMISSAVEVGYVRTGREVNNLARDGAIFGEMLAAPGRQARMFFCAILVNNSD